MKLWKRNNIISIFVVIVVGISGAYYYSKKVNNELDVSLQSVNIISTTDTEKEANMEHVNISGVRARYFRTIPQLKNYSPFIIEVQIADERTNIKLNNSPHSIVKAKITEVFKGEDVKSGDEITIFEMSGVIEKSQVVFIEDD
jgi:hypothetical protein